MTKTIRHFILCIAILGLGLTAATQPGFTAAGSPPDGPIDSVKTGADLKFACGQDVEGFSGIVGEKMYRSMLIVQCRAVVGTVAGLMQAGQLAFDDKPKWQCVTIPDNLNDLSATFVTWIGRKPALMRQPAAVAFVEAIEASAPCRETS